eukprot:6491640-Amphidinium_carterae.1
MLESENTSRYHLPAQATRAQKSLGHTERRIRRLRDAQTQRITGRQMFVSHMATKFHAANEIKVASGQRPWSWNKVWSFHGEEWRHLSDDEHRRFEALAAGLRAQRATENESEIQASQAKKQALLRETASKPSHVVPMTFGACKLSAQDVEDMGCFRAATLPTSSGPQSAHSLLQACALPASDETFAAYVERSDLPEPLIDTSSLMRSCCALRETLQFSVLEADCEDGCYYFMFSLVVKRPCEIVMLRLEEVETCVAEESGTSLALTDGGAAPRPVKCFRCEGGFFADSSLWHSLEGLNLNIYENALFCGQGIVAVFSSGESLAKIVAAHVREGVSARQPRGDDGGGSSVRPRSAEQSS